MKTACYPERAVVHINVADFAVAVERLSAPGLHDRPVIVAAAGSARALVYDMSEEAFRSGVRKRMPLERARRLCPGVRVVSPRPHLYARAMDALLDLARPFSPLIESEGGTGHIFMDLRGTGRLFGPPQDVAWRIRRQARQSLGLDPVWALAANKLVAKAATRLVKPDGEHVVAHGDEAAFVRPLSLHLLPGLEAPDLALLAQYNLRRVEHVLPWRVEQLATIFGQRGAEVHALLRGKDDAPVLADGLGPPVVRLEHEFADDTNDPRQVERALLALCQRAGAMLRAMGRAARQLALTLTYSDGARVTRQRGHALGTANDFSLFDLARATLTAAWLRRVRLRHLHLSCQRLVFPPAQMDLPFWPSPEQIRLARQDKLVVAMDRVRQRHGESAIALGRLLEQ